MKCKILFSIPIHQRLEVVVDQICNIKYFVPDSAIVFHFSQVFDYETSKVSKEDFIRIAKQEGDVFINPNSLRTGLGDILQAHLSNFEYALKEVDFEYFAMCASNESFIKSGLYDFISLYDCGVKQSLDVTDYTDNQCFAKDIQNDPFMKQMLNDINFDRIIGATVEGQYYKKELFKEICDTINRNFDYTKVTYFYPRDEYFISTVLASIKKKRPELRISHQYTYSAYHYDHLFDTTPYEIKKIEKGPETLFSTKRVDRNIDDVVRAYLRQKHNYLKKERILLGIEIKEQSLLQIHWGAIRKILLSLWKKKDAVFKRFL